METTEAAISGMYLATLLYIFPKVVKDDESSPLPRREGQAGHISGKRKVYLKDDTTGQPSPKPVKRPESAGNAAQTSSPLRVFVYDLPSEFNSGLVHCIQVKNRCYQLQDYGMGLEFARYGNVSFRSTHMFSLEVILHQKLLSSTFRTLDPEKADVFYIPYYPALAAACEPVSTIDSPALDRELWQFITSNYPYFQQGKPHMMALGRIEREHADVTGGILKTRESRSVTFVAIEHESDPKTLKFIRRSGLPMVVAPYPSCGHLLSDNKFGGESKSERTQLDIPRDVLVLFAGSRRMSHDIRRILSQQLRPTSEKYDATSSLNKQNVWVITQECRDRSWQENLGEWMHHSVFCLQPPGDSPTRKSFFDAVQCGCIPVIFKLDHEPVYPFDDVLDYSKFTVKVTDGDFFQEKRSIVDILQDIPEAVIAAKRAELRQVTPLLQYSYPPLPETHVQDAFDMIMQEIGRTRGGRSNVRRRYGSKVRKVVGRGAGGWVVQ
ncbi:probable xyloglucan galactosyltransferase GT20 [Branchiostoma floridae]|uniref:Probable xyloglucan galactosyltransferase GT20 n=1 Tax=Branchiostoma floridae TaxID=7739 RepID=A0A9J7MSB4_BRAFL|nr:probable xyloglucan galactosyltransferase GT20 [Branchiostoma floridae]